MTWSRTCWTCGAAGRRLRSSWRRSPGAMRASAAARPFWSGPRPRRWRWVACSGPRGPSTSGCATGIRSSGRRWSAWSPVASGVWWRSCSRLTIRLCRSARTRKSCSMRREAGAVMTELAATRKNFLIVPIGFVSDHVEVLYDVDVAYRGLAERLGVRLERTDSLNDDPLLVAALADLARRTATERGWV